MFRQSEQTVVFWDNLTSVVSENFCYQFRLHNSYSNQHRLGKVHMRKVHVSGVLIVTKQVYYEI